MNLSAASPAFPQYSCATLCPTPDLLRATKNKTAGPRSAESAVIMTAATGTPPAPHGRATACIRPRALGFSADRTGRDTKCLRHAGTHGVCAGPQVERDARLRHAEGSSVPHALFDRERQAVPQPPGCPWLDEAKTAGQGIALEGTRRRAVGGAWSACGERDSGRLAASCTRLIGRRLSAPTHGTSVPLPGSARGC